MKIFQDLFIHLNGNTIESLIEECTKQCNEFWKRAVEREENASSLGEKAYCFEHSEGDGLRNAGLTLFEKENNTWYVPNIVPIKTGQLSHNEYNDLLNSFIDSIVKPVIIGSPVQIEITNNQIFLEDVVGIEATDKLKRFSILANMSTGSSHPMDKGRWFDFLFTVSNKGVELDTDLLMSSLIKQGWSEESAHELAIEFEFAQGLLDYAKGR